MEKLKVLDLFSGIGGFSLGLERTGGFETVAFCEIEEFPRKVLAKNWPNVPCFPDVTKLKGSDVGQVDVICGGYPCQPFSTAGKRQGKEDDRHLWPEFMRLVVELRPTWVIGENVAGHVSMGLDDVLSDLEGEGYTCRPFIIPACAKDAKHRRDRVWTIAYANDVLADTSPTERKRRRNSRGRRNGLTNVCDALARSERIGQPGQGSCRNASDKTPPSQGQATQSFDGGVGGFRTAKPGVGGMASRLSPWLDEPAIGRVATGVPQRVDRLKALGNAVVPQIPEMIGYAILEAECDNPPHTINPHNAS